MPRHRCAARFSLILLSVAGLLLAACGKAPLHQQESFVFGTRVEILIAGLDETQARPAAAAVLRKVDDTGAVLGVSGGTGMGHTLQHYKDIIVTPTAYGQGLTFLMLTELQRQEANRHV